MNKKCRSVYTICIALVSVVVTACTTTRSEPTDAFLEPISEQTTAIISDVNFAMPLADSVMLNHYYDENTPNVDEWLVVFDDLVAAIRAISYYSSDLLDVVDAAEDASAIEPVISLIATLDSEIRTLSSAPQFMGDVDAQPAFVAMREQENIAAALRAAQPLMDDYALVVTEILAAADQALADAVVELFKLIEASHSPMLAYGENLTVRQNGILAQLHYLDKAWGGDSDAWAELLASDWALSSEIGKNAPLTSADVRVAEQFLIDRLGTVATIREQLEPALIAYQLELQELYAIEEEAEATLRVALLIVDSWSAAQANLAHGEKGAITAFAKTLAQLAYRSAASRIGRRQ
jgi:hypothetical protein